MNNVEQRLKAIREGAIPDESSDSFYIETLIESVIDLGLMESDSDDSISLLTEALTFSEAMFNALYTKMANVEKLINENIDQYKSIGEKIKKRKEKEPLFYTTSFDMPRAIDIRVEMYNLYKKSVSHELIFSKFSKPDIPKNELLADETLLNNIMNFQLEEFRKVVKEFKSCDTYTLKTYKLGKSAVYNPHNIMKSRQDTLRNIKDMLDSHKRDIKMFREKVKQLDKRKDILFFRSKLIVLINKSITNSTFMLTHLIKANVRFLKEDRKILNKLKSQLE